VTTIQVDKTDPTVEARGAPDPSRWLRMSVAFDIVGADQPGLSGMAPATPDEPIEKGAFVQYGVDGGELQRTRGVWGHVVVDDETLTRGVYELRARVVDQAGNEAVGSRRRDGSPARVDTSTLRAATRLVVGLRGPTPRGRKHARHAGGLVGTLTVPFGKPAL